MKHLLIYILAATLTVLGACSSASDRTRDALDYVREELGAGNSVEAKRAADDLLASGDALSASQLATLSLLYMQLGERDDMDDNTAIAFQCYRNALKADPDSARAVFAAVTGDNARYVLILQSLQQIMETPRSVFDEEPDLPDPSPDKN